MTTPRTFSETDALTSPRDAYGVRTPRVVPDASPVRLVTERGVGRRGRGV